MTLFVRLFRFTVAAASIVAASALTSCTQEMVMPTSEDVVIRAYLYAGAPVQDVRVMSSFAIGGTDSTNLPISTASVALFKQMGASERRYQLRPDSEQAGNYRYGGNDLQIASGDRFRLEVTYNGNLITAETTVPQPPANVRPSLSVLNVTKESITLPFGTLTSVVSADSLSVHWDNASKDYHYTLVENIDPQRVKIRTDTIPIPRFVSQPTTDERQRVITQSLSYTGKYRVLVYRVNKEYAELYRSRDQDSRSLREPATNIRGGLGIFTAFAADSTFFQVVLR